MSPDTRMEPDTYQQAWRAQSSQTRVAVDADLLLQEVQRNQRDFLAAVSRRDLLEVGTTLLLLPIWFYLGAVFSLPWTWYLSVPAMAWIAGFILYYRLRYPLKVSDPDEPLVDCVRHSLSQVEQQSWLLRNVFWWYLLPPCISLLAFFGHVTWLRSTTGQDALGRADVFIVLLGVYALHYFWNRHTVESKLEPRRKELLTLLASLGDEKAGKYTTENSLPRGNAAVGLWHWLFLTGLFVLALVTIPLAGGFFDFYYDQTPQSSGPAGHELASLITQQRKEKNLVGLAAMVMVDGNIEAAAAQGERKKGSGVPLELGDLWHLGGIAKPITATMMARLVEAGRMQWTDTVGEIFPDASVHKDWKPVTLEQLLTDTAGAPRNFGLDVLRLRPALGRESSKARREAVLDLMAEAPAYPPGSKFAYSNVGYPIAAAMAEKATGEIWEDLVKREVFEPLRLTESGFGPPKSGDHLLQQPRGHHTALGWKIAVDDEADNTGIMGPSAIVHMSLENLCRFAMEHLRGELGNGKLLATEMYKKLHTPKFDPYAFGWVKYSPTSQIPYTVYWHNGSNTMWYSLVVFIPEKRMAVAVASNDGDFESAEAAAWRIVEASASQFNIGRNPTGRAFTDGTGYPRKSPFAAVRWQDAQPEVKVDGEWFKLVSIDELPTAGILRFSRRTYGDKWQKRFEEDLVELLSRIGHPPRDEVTLVVQSLDSAETQVFDGVPMTESNRQAIKQAALARERAASP